MTNNSRWFLPWTEIASTSEVVLERQELGQYRVRVSSDLTEHHTYYFHSSSDAHDCFQHCKQSIAFEKGLINSVL